MLRACADQFALMIENARLTDCVVEQETLRRDIALASDVQRRLLPEAPPHSECVDFAAASVPARRIGGDYYDFVELTGGRIGIALADVSGKGVAAALIMSVVQASLRIISSEGDVPLPRLVARMNEFVYRSTPASKYATFFYAQLERDFVTCPIICRSPWRPRRSHALRSSTFASRRRRARRLRRDEPRPRLLGRVRRPAHRSPDGLEGHGLTFTIGRGNELCVAGVHALAPLVIGVTLERSRRTWPRSGDA